MLIKVLQLGMVVTNCYVFWDEGSNLCGVVDPGDDGAQIAALIRENGLTLQAILLTHGHFDHILGIRGLRKVWPEVPIYCHPGDVTEGQTTVSMFGATFPAVSSFPNVHLYREGDRVDVGPLRVRVLETPGHTPGSVTLQVEDVLFTGDTLFHDSIGRTDFEGGDLNALLRSLAKLGRLEGDYQVLPGHEESSTLEWERRHNQYMLHALHS